MENREGLEKNITLKDYVDVLVKRKKLVVLVFLFSAVIGVIITLAIPKIYNIYMIIEPHVLGFSDTGGIHSDSPANIKRVIEMKTFTKKIVGAMGKDFAQKNFSFDIFCDDGNLLKISIEEPSGKINIGIALLLQQFEHLTKMYGEVVDYKKMEIEKNIDSMDNAIAAQLNATIAAQGKIKILDAREQELMSEIATTKSNTERLVSDRGEALLNKKENNEAISSLLYSNTIQQNIYYFNLLTGNLSELKLSKERLFAEIKALESEVEEKKLEKEKLVLSKERVRNVRMIQEPVVSFASPKPDKKIIIAIVIMGSITLSIFVAFFLQYWANIKKQ